VLVQCSDKVTGPSLAGGGGTASLGVIELVYMVKGMSLLLAKEHSSAPPGGAPALVQTDT
jgi:hypothetical protein